MHCTREGKDYSEKNTAQIKKRPWPLIVPYTGISLVLVNWLTFSSNSRSLEASCVSPANLPLVSQINWMPGNRWCGKKNKKNRVSEWFESLITSICPHLARVAWTQANLVFNLVFSLYGKGHHQLPLHSLTLLRRPEKAFQTCLGLEAGRKWGWEWYVRRMEEWSWEMVQIMVFITGAGGLPM